MMLQAVLRKNLKMWEECLLHVEFAYNREVHSTTKFCPFELVYGFKPIAPIDLLPFPLQERTSLDASKHADFVKKLHAQAKENIEKRTEKYTKRVNKTRKKLVFEQGDLVWVHLRKDRFPKQRKCKLRPCGDGPFAVLKGINDNAYKIDLPEEYGVSPTFNVSDLSPYFGPLESRTTSSQEGEDDEDIPAMGTTPPTINGPITRSCAMRMHDQVNANLSLSFDLENRLCLHLLCCWLNSGAISKKAKHISVFAKQCFMAKKQS